MEEIAKPSRPADCPIPPSVERAREWVDQNFRANPSLAEVAAVSKISRFYFHRLFKRLTGKTLKDYVDELRMGEAKQLLLKGIPSTEVSKRLGFSSKSHFTSRFREHVGVPPAQWAKASRGGEGERATGAAVNESRPSKANGCMALQDYPGTRGSRAVALECGGAEW